MKRIIIGITGMPGSGKSTVAKVGEKLGFKVIRMGDVVREETLKRGLEPTRENLCKMMFTLRAESGPDVVAKKCLSRISLSDRNVIIDGIRSLHEVEFFKKKLPSFILLAVHSSPKTRFKRLYSRRRSDDPKDKKEFIERDKKELSVGIGSAIAMADYMIINEGSLDEFKKMVRSILINLKACEASMDFMHYK